MGRKYIKQIINQNFIYPNDNVAEYDVEIVHDINNNCVSGTVTNFSATTVSSTGITFTYNSTWALNNAEPFIRNSNELSIYSMHLIAPGQSFYKPWRLVQNRSSTGTTATTFTETGATFSITPSQMGVSSFTNGTYYFEFRMIGHRCIFPICLNLTISSLTPPPTATATPTPTPTLTGPTPTPTATTIPCTSGATLNVTDTGWLKYTDCEGFDVYVQYTSTGSKTITDCLRCSTIRDGIPFADLASFTVTNCGNSCNIITPTPTPTGTGPTPTPTATGGKSIELRVLDIASTPQTITMYYNVNSGSNINIPGGTSVTFPITCTLLYTIPGLTTGDVVLFGTSIYCAMEGAGGTGCPGFVGSLTTYSYVVDAPSVQTLSLTIDTQTIP